MISLLILKRRPDNTQELLDQLGSIKPVPPAGEPPAETPQIPPAASGDRADVVSWVRANAQRYGIDPAAALAVAAQEGIGGGIGDGGLAYGPWQDHVTEFSRLPFSGPIRNNADVQAFMWTPAGFDFVMRSMVAAGASGLTGAAAISAIVYKYERPQDPDSEYRKAVAVYNQWVA